MEKPLPVKIVECLGWAYVAFAVLLFIAFFVSSVAWCTRPSDWLSALVALSPLALAVGMALALRKGQRAWFVVPNAAVWCLPVIVAVAGLFEPLPASGWIWGGVGLVLLVSPGVLLYLPSSNRWFREKTGGKTERKDFLLYLVTALIVVLLSPFVSEALGSGHRQRGRVARLSAMAMRGRNLLVCMVQNDVDREAGKAWVDPAAFTNSTQFVQALYEKGEGESEARACTPVPYADVWCIAVNPPEDDAFPRAFTCNLDPCELLRPQDENRLLKLTCPKTWGGTCFGFCENAAVVVYVGGSAQAVAAKYASKDFVFPNGIPKPGPATYFLTPTGRVDCVTPGGRGELPH